MPEALFQEFSPVTKAQWDAVITKDLKGADYEKKLVWNVPSGMAVRPYYRREDIAGFDWLEAAPGTFPYARGANAKGGWSIREPIDHSDPAPANRAARAAVAAGAEEIAFGKIAIGNVSDIALLLGGLDNIPVHLACNGDKLMRRLLQYLGKHPRTAEVTTTLDPLLDLDLSEQTAKVAPPELIPFMIDAARIEEAGATTSEQVGFALAAGIDYLDAMARRGIEPARAAVLVQFGFTNGGNYFFEIAKLRAFRMLWARAAESFGVPPDKCRAFIETRTSRWNQTIYDPHVNVLRSTTEAMSAIIGGADSISVCPFDACYHRPDEDSRRLARNTQIMLKHEAMLGHVADPGGGSYALEAITEFLARDGWNLMQEVETRGGYRKASGWITERLLLSLAEREKRVASRKRIFVGTNQYANAAERALGRIEPARIVQPRRGTIAFEALRLRTERHGQAPHILLAEIGDPKMRAARATFASNFFACAGFDILAMRFNSVEEIVAQNADVIVLCSSDQEYAGLAATLIPALKDAGLSTPVVVAGSPDNSEELKTLGIAEFIHVRSNPLEVLADWQQWLGVRR